MKGGPPGDGPDEERLDDDGEAVTKRIALMRARGEAERSAALLRARGFLTALAPATEIRATGALPPPGPFDAVIATSAKAIALLAPAARDRIAGAPLFVVGRRTARAARDAGMRATWAFSGINGPMSSVTSSKKPRLKGIGSRRSLP